MLARIGNEKILHLPSFNPPEAPRQRSQSSAALAPVAIELHQTPPTLRPAHALASRAPHT